MRLPFFDRFITKNKHFVDMEEIIDKMLREMMRRPGEDYLQIADSINASEQHAENAMEQMIQIPMMSFLHFLLLLIFQLLVYQYKMF